MSVPVIILSIVFLGIGLSGVKIFKEYQRGVVFRLGRLVSARGPGLSYVIPLIEKMIRVDMRIVTIIVPVPIDLLGSGLERTAETRSPDHIERK